MKTMFQPAILVLVTAVVVAVVALPPLLQQTRSASVGTATSDAAQAGELDQILSTATVPVLVDFYADW